MVALLTAPGEFVRGCGYVLRGARLLRAQRGLWPLALAPALIMLACLASIPPWLLGKHAALSGALWRRGAEDGWLGTLGRVAHGAFDAVLWVLLLGLALMLAAAVANALAAPASDLLSERVEERCTGRPAPPFRIAHVLQESGRVIALGGIRAALYGGALLGGWLLAWALPGVGHLLQLALSVPLTLAYLSLDQVDFAAARRGWSVRERLGLVWKRPALMLGFGLGVWCCLCIPFVNLLLVPVSVTGGTLLVLDLQRDPRSA
jgi:CysZ protein